MMRPVIGITTDCNDKSGAYESPFSYAAAIEKAGGLPLLLPYRADPLLVERYFDLMQGVLFSGGDDLNPQSWGEQYHPKTIPLDPLRERFERALLAEAEKRQIPTLGMCMGAQLMNVHRGGSLHQFLPDLPRSEPIEHRKTGSVEDHHPVTLLADSVIARAVGRKQLVVNTSHKQAIHRLGQGLRIIATAPDGVIEGIEDPSLPLFLGVQWHAERMHEQPEHLALFRLLVDRATGK